jgi:ubiquitin-protein ligase
MNEYIQMDSNIPTLIIKSSTSIGQNNIKKHVEITYDDVDDEMGLYEKNQLYEYEKHDDKFPYNQTVLIEKAELLVKGKESNKSKETFSNIGSIKIIINELRYLSNLDNFTVKLYDNNIFNIEISINANFFGINSKIRQQMLDTNSSLVLKIEIEPKLYPFYPPKVRVISPRLKNELMTIIATMDFLKASNWNPIYNLEFIINVVKEILDEYGELNIENGNNYNILELKLIDLAIFTETIPKLNIKPIIDKFINTNTNDLINNPNQNQNQKKSYWKNGTGFGYGALDISKQWDPVVIESIKKERNTNIMNCLLDINKILAKIIISDSNNISKYNQILLNSCIIPYIRNYFNSTGLLEMFQNINLFNVIFEFLQIINEDSFMEIFIVKDQNQSIYESLCKVCCNYRAYLNNLNSMNINKTLDPAIVEEKVLIEQFLSYIESLSLNYNKHFDMMITQNSSSSTNDKSKLDDKSKTKSSKKNKKTKTSINSTNLTPQENYIKQLYDELFHFVSMDSSNFISDKRGGYNGNKAATTVNKEIIAIKDLLPLNYESSIFHRTDESNTRWHRFMITGPESTPYESGCFLFSLQLFNTYPNTPPRVLFLTTNSNTIKFNPNLYEDGTVCLSLLGTWNAERGESWIPGESSIMQVLISIQSLILVPEPYFNEPGYEIYIGTEDGKINSNIYNENIRYNTLKYAIIEMIKNPPDHFKNAIFKHFSIKKDTIIACCKKWVDEASNKEKFILIQTELLNVLNNLQ